MDDATAQDMLFKRKHELYYLNSQIRDLQSKLNKAKLFDEGTSAHMLEADLYLSQVPSMSMRIREKLVRLRMEEARLRVLLQDKKVRSDSMNAIIIRTLLLISIKNSLKLKLESTSVNKWRKTQLLGYLFC